MADAEQQLKLLQQSYDEYVESSKEIEKELDAALEAAESKVNDLTTKKLQVEQKLTVAQEKASQITKEQLTLQSHLSKSQEQLSTCEEVKRTLEASNDSLHEQVRILQATEADLLHKNNLLQEQVVFLQTDIAELKEANKDSEFRLKEELTSLQAELAAISSSNENGEQQMNENGEQQVVAVSDEVTVEATISEQAQLVEALEIEVEELTGKLTQTEQQNSELSEELNRVADELLQVHQSHDTLMIEKAQLENQIAVAENALLAASKQSIMSIPMIVGEAQTGLESTESTGSNEAASEEPLLEEHMKAVESQVQSLSEQLAFVASELISKTEEMRLIQDEHDSVEAIWLEEKSQYDVTIQALKREVENQKEAVDILRASLRNHQMEAEVQAGTANIHSQYTL